MKLLSAFFGLVLVTTVYAQTATLSARDFQCAPSPTGTPGDPDGKAQLVDVIIEQIEEWRDDIKVFNNWINVNSTLPDSNLTVSIPYILQETNVFRQQACMAGLLRSDDFGGTLVVSNLDVTLQHMRNTMENIVQGQGGTCQTIGTNFRLDESVRQDWCQALTHTLELWQEIFCGKWPGGCYLHPQLDSLFLHHRALHHVRLRLLSRDLLGLFPSSQIQRSFVSYLATTTFTAPTVPFPTSTKH